jgi:hypothetical protein
MGRAGRSAQLPCWCFSGWPPLFTGAGSGSRPLTAGRVRGASRPPRRLLSRRGRHEDHLATQPRPTPQKRSEGKSERAAQFNDLPLRWRHRCALCLQQQEIRLPQWFCRRTARVGWRDVGWPSCSTPRPEGSRHEGCLGRRVALTSIFRQVGNKGRTASLSSYSCTQIFYCV